MATKLTSAVIKSKTRREKFLFVNREKLQFSVIPTLSKSLCNEINNDSR